LLLLAACAVSVSCSGRPPNPDPGNRTLRLLAADPMAVRLPPGAVRVSREQNPARFQDNGVFEGSGWVGPYVAVTFRSSRSVTDVYRFYAVVAASDGRKPWAELTKGITRGWTKDIAGQRSYASLESDAKGPIPGSGLTESGTPRNYTLSVDGWLFRRPPCRRPACR
jgi:hypothetical protein